MPNLHELFDERSRAHYRPTLSVEDIRQAGDRRRRAQRAWVAAVAACVVVVALVSALVIWKVMGAPKPRGVVDVAGPGTVIPTASQRGELPPTRIPLPPVVRSGWLPAVDQLGWPLADFTSLRVAGDMSSRCPGLGALDTNAGIVGQIRGRAGSEVAVTAFGGKVDKATEALRACQIKENKITGPITKGGVTAWDSLSRSESAKTLFGKSAVLTVGERTYVVELLWHQALGDNPYGANWDALVSRLRAGVGTTADQPLGFSAGAVSPSTFIGASDVRSPGTPWQEWMYDEDGSDPGEGFNDGHPRTMMLTLNSVELVAHGKLLANADLSASEARRAVSVKTLAGAKFEPVNIPGASYAQLGSVEGRPMGIMACGKYAFVVTVRGAQDPEVVKRAMQAQAARVS